MKDREDIGRKMISIREEIETVELIQKELEKLQV
jgi:hypothetical protein